MGATRSQHAIYEQIHKEHAALRTMQSRVDQTLADERADEDHVVELLCRLYDALRNHFLSEEEGGFFLQISGDAPRLATRADGLTLEHRDLLHRAAELVGHATVRASAPFPWQELRTEFRDLSRQLRQHESEENQLLQEAYQDDFGGDD